MKVKSVSSKKFNAEYAEWIFVDLPRCKTIIHMKVAKDLQWKPGD